MQKIRENAWFQGALLTKSLSKKLATEKGLAAKNGDFLVLINQDCDVLHGSYENEPYAEFLLAEKISKDVYEVIKINGRHPRILHFQINGEYYKAHHYKKITISREILESNKPNSKIFLDKATLNILPQWIGKKYFRVAFPDNFDARYKGTKEFKKITKLIKQNATCIEDLYIRLNTKKELEEGNPYKVMLWATVSDPAVNIEKVQEVIDKIAAHMDSCDGIEVIDSKANYDEDVKLADVRGMDIWDYYDYLSSDE